MIELQHDSLKVSFAEVHEDAHMSINFQRTLRIPDDGRVHYLPPGLGSFPLRHVDDFASTVPESWKEHGGVMMPMWQSEALWISFSSRFGGYPCLVKIATGKINAVSGEQWREGAHRDPQDYVVVPDQPWLDGYCVKKGEIAQFVAMPLGDGYTAEEQITGEAEHGGLQVMVYPMKAEEWEKLLKQRAEEDMLEDRVMFSVMECSSPHPKADMGLAPGGRMKQDIEEDPYDMNVWDLRHGSRVFVHLANSLNWRAITGEAPPTVPPTARQYMKAGLPWFDHYAKGEAVKGSDQLEGLQTVLDLGKQKGENPLPENDSFDPGKVPVVDLGHKKDTVREGDF